jgi:hypothetical protein
LEQHTLDVGKALLLLLSLLLLLWQQVSLPHLMTALGWKQLLKPV